MDEYMDVGHIFVMGLTILAISAREVTVLFWHTKTPDNESAVFPIVCAAVFDC